MSKAVSRSREEGVTGRRGPRGPLKRSVCLEGRHPEKGSCKLWKREMPFKCRRKRNTCDVKGPFWTTAEKRQMNKYRTYSFQSHLPFIPPRCNGRISYSFQVPSASRIVGQRERKGPEGRVEPRRRLRPSSRMPRGSVVESEEPLLGAARSSPSISPQRCYDE